MKLGIVHLLGGNIRGQPRDRPLGSAGTARGVDLALLEGRKVLGVVGAVHVTKWRVAETHVDGMRSLSQGLFRRRGEGLDLWLCGWSLLSEREVCGNCSFGDLDAVPGRGFDRLVERAECRAVR